MNPSQYFVHPTAEVSTGASIGAGTRVWHQAQVREGASIGKNCIISKGVYVDFGVTIGDNVKIQNGAFVYHGVTVEAGVFIGPGVILTNDRRPRAINPDETLKGDTDWQVGTIVIRRGASIGAGAIILPDVCVGEFAMVGAGAIVTRNVPSHGLVYGNPARLHGYTCCCGHPLDEVDNRWKCNACGRSYAF